MTDRPAPSTAPDAPFDEERARAEVYALIARLFHAPADAALLARLAPTVQVPEDAVPLAATWAALGAAARATTPAQADDEYATLFGGVGKPDVYLFGSHYLAGFLNEKPLARLREDLDRLGLRRDDAVSDTEDHVACLCDAMRVLIAEGTPLGTQKTFFAAHLQPWVATMCEQLAARPSARFYRAAANFARAFVEVEAQAFDLLA
jgi:TorA maturation chaperone TorD